jgi:hypothetical protein
VCVKQKKKKKEKRRKNVRSGPAVLDKVVKDADSEVVVKVRSDGEGLQHLDYVREKVVKVVQEPYASVAKHRVDQISDLWWCCM